eukprot:1161408-Pelagomonas_calceolata.AAC.3
MECGVMCMKCAVRCAYGVRHDVHMVHGVMYTPLSACVRQCRNKTPATYWRKGQMGAAAAQSSRSFPRRRFASKTKSGLGVLKGPGQSLETSAELLVHP